MQAQEGNLIKALETQDECEGIDSVRGEPVNLSIDAELIQVFL